MHQCPYQKLPSDHLKVWNRGWWREAKPLNNHCLLKWLQVMLMRNIREILIILTGFCLSRSWKHPSLNFKTSKNISTNTNKKSETRWILCNIFTGSTNLSMISSKQALDASSDENGRYSTAERKSLYIVCKLLREKEVWACTLNSFKITELALLS